MKNTPTSMTIELKTDKKTTSRTLGKTAEGMGIALSRTSNDISFLFSSIFAISYCCDKTLSTSVSCPT